MKKFKSYIITWRPDENVGHLHKAMVDNKGADLPIDNPKEALFLLNLIRHEPVIHFDPEHHLIATGMDIPEQEASITQTSVEAQAANDEDFNRKKEYALSVIGIGDKTAEILLEYTNDFQDFATAEQLSKHLGLVFSSGQTEPSVDVNGDLDGSGPDLVRGLLYMCTRSAIEHNRACEKLYDRLEKEGKEHILAAMAVMNKLVEQVYECVTTQTMFEDES